MKLKLGQNIHERVHVFPFLMNAESAFWKNEAGLRFHCLSGIFNPCYDFSRFCGIIFLFAFTAFYIRLGSLVDENMEVEIFYIFVSAYLTWYEFLNYFADFHNIS